MDKNKIAIYVLGVLGLGVLAVMAYMTYHSNSATEAGGWIAAGYMALREVVSKIENVAVGPRVEPEPAEGG